MEKQTEIIPFTQVRHQCPICGTWIETNKMFSEELCTICKN